MGTLYNSTPGSTGGFSPLHSGYAGYQNFSQNIPYFKDRSKLATIPEFMREPGLLNKSLLIEIKEGRAEFLKVLYEYASKNPMTVPDVKFRQRVKVAPHNRFYLAEKAFAVASNLSTFELSSFTRPTPSVSSTTGNQKVVGNIARLEAGMFIVLMFSWVAQGRTTTAPQYGTGSSQYPLPELCKIRSVNYEANTLVVERNWAGSQRTSAAAITTTCTVVANTATPSTNQVNAKDAFFMVLPKSMKEDEIDAKVHGYTQTWAEGILQRNLRAWGSGTLSEIVNKNLGNRSKYDESREEAIENYYKDLELAAFFGERSESWDNETDDWSGTTDGIFANIPKSHFVGLVPINYAYIRQTPAVAWGSFDIPIFNQIMENKGYFGSGRKIAICGSSAYTAFSTMINHMTQDVPTIQSDWKVTGRRFQSSGGLTVDFIQSDALSLNGMRNKMILVDPEYFSLVGLQNYPTDIVEVQNENKLKQNGFIHGVFGFLDKNPDAHWVFTLDDSLKTATFNATYAQNILGVEHV